MTIEEKRVVALIEAKKRIEDIAACQERNKIAWEEQKKMRISLLVESANEKIAFAVAKGWNEFTLLESECDYVGLEPEDVIELLKGSDYEFKYVESSWLSWEYWNTAIGSETYKFKIIKKEK